MAKETKEAKETKAGEAPAQPAPSKDELIGYHKGSINTLLAERNELIKIIQVTENLIQAHAQELGKLGVKITSEEVKK